MKSKCFFCGDGFTEPVSSVFFADTEEAEAEESKNGETPHEANDFL